MYAYIMDICIMHTCMYQGVRDHASWLHVYIRHGYMHIAYCIMNTSAWALRLECLKGAEDKVKLARGSVGPDSRAAYKSGLNGSRNF